CRLVRQAHAPGGLSTGQQAGHVDPNLRRGWSGDPQDHPRSPRVVESAAYRMRNRFLDVAWVLMWARLSGCGGSGPPTVSHDRFDYTDAIATSWKQQMLINIVKLRYGDTPVFLDVASVINQYSREAAMDLALTWVDPHISVVDSQSTGASARYTDKPTITYTPLSGERFARSLMKPIPPTAVLSLIQAGYPVDVVLRTCVHPIKGIRNRDGGAARARGADPEFFPLLQRMRRVQDAGGLGLRVQKDGEV